MATDDPSTAGTAAGKPEPIPATFLHGDELPASIEVVQVPETVSLDLEVGPTGDGYHVVLTRDAALDLALRLVGSVMRQRKQDS